MKQTILSILGCMVIAFAITGCVGSRNQFDIGSKSDIQISSNDVSISIKEGTLTNTGATLILTNNSDKEFQYGDSYEIEIKKGKKWYKINVKLYFNLPAFFLKSKESKEIELNWENEYGKLAKGTYRIIKDINYEKGKGNFEGFNIATEFTIN